MHPQEVIPVRPTVPLDVVAGMAVQPLTLSFHCFDYQLFFSNSYRLPLRQ